MRIIHQDKLLTFVYLCALFYLTKLFENNYNLSIAMQEPVSNKNEINIELSEEIAEGVYANLSIISHSDAEFILDFIRMVPNVPKAKVKSRIIMTPQQTKRLLQALSENVKRYEAANGTIQDNSSNGIPFPMNFNTPKGQA